MSRARVRAGAWAAVGVALAVGLLTPAFASAVGRPYVAVGPLRKARPALARQLRHALCAELECVPWDAVADGRSFHVARARAAGVAGILVGSVDSSRGRPTLTVLLFEDRPRPTARWRLALTRLGLASQRDLRELVAALEQRLGAAGEPPASASASASAARDPGRAPHIPAAPAPDRGDVERDLERGDGGSAPAPPPTGPALPMPVPAPAPGETERVTLPVPSAPRLVEPPGAGEDEPGPRVMRLPAMALPGSDRGSQRMTASRARTDADRALPATPWLAVEAGVVVARSDLTFQGAAASPGPLRGHDVPALAAPRLGVELQPGAWFTDGALSGLSLQGRVTLAAGTRTEVAGTSHATSMSWLSAGVAWRSAPPLGPRASVSAAVSWERRDVTVSPPVPGLADRRLSGVKGCVGVSLPIGRASAFVRAGYVAWLDAPDLIGGRTPFFPGGSAWGVEGEAGLALRLTGAWSIELGAEYASTWYRLARDPEGVYSARSARDAQIAGQTAVRLTL